MKHIPGMHEIGKEEFYSMEHIQYSTQLARERFVDFVRKFKCHSVVGDLQVKGHKNDY